MPHKCVAVAYNSNGEKVSCSCSESLIKLFPSQGKNSYNAPTCANAKEGDSNWITVSPRVLADHRRLCLEKLGRGTRRGKKPPPPTARACMEHFQIVHGQARPWRECFWRNPRTGTYKLVYFKGHGFAAPLFKPGADQRMTRSATQAAAEEVAAAEAAAAEATGSTQLTPANLAGQVRMQARESLVTPVPTVDWEDRVHRKRRQSEEKTAARVAREESKSAPMYTFEALQSAPPKVLASLTSFRAMDTLESLYDYLDALGELSSDALVRYKWTSTHTEHFHKENGDQPAWVGDGLSASQDQTLDDIRRGACATDSVTSDNEGQTAAPADKRKHKRARRVKQTVADISIPEPAPRVAAATYQASKARSQSSAVSGRQMLLFALLVLCGGRPLHVAGWETGVPSGQESRVFTTMIMLMFWTFKRDQPFPSQRRCRSRCPQHYADVLGTGDVRVCLDCTEFSAEGHADLRQAIASYSKYKKGTTIKFLVAISASGAIVFVSYGYPGRITDPQITEACGIAELLSQGDAVLADRGFLIAQLLADVKAHLLVSHTRFSKANRYTPDQLLHSKRLSNVRIHVERAMAALKSFGYFQRKLPTSQKNMVYPCFSVASALANFRKPLLNNEDQDRVAAGTQGQPPPPLPDGYSVVGEEMDLGSTDDVARLADELDI